MVGCTEFICVFPRALIVGKGADSVTCCRFLFFRLLLFFMPEGCTVRDRMVYAASSAALKDGLGQVSSSTSWPLVMQVNSSILTHTLSVYVTFVFSRVISKLLPSA
jgi:hypothetical protein